MTLGEAMSADVCHISVHTGDEPDVVDLVLPNRLPVAALLPDIVELAVAGHAAEPGPWQLSTVCGTVLDESAALREQGVGDGDLLLLSPAQPLLPAFGRPHPVAAVLAAAPQPGDARALRVTAGLVAASAGIAAFATARGVAALVTAAALTCMVAGVAVIASRARRAAWVCAPLGCLTVLMAALCGALAVPGPFGASHALLAGAVAAAVALMLLRLRIGSATAATTVACVGVLGTVAMSGAVLWHWPIRVVGIVVLLLALGALSLAPRLSVVLSGLAPAVSAPDDPHLDADRRARTGHRVLIGLVTGACLTTGLGAVVLAAGCLRGSGQWWAGATLCAVVGIGLVSRTRCYAAGRCRWALMFSGMCCLAAGFVVVVGQHGPWVAVVAVGAGVAVIAVEPAGEPSPVAARALEVSEYAVLAAVAPVACAALDVFTLVRSASLM